MKKLLAILLTAAMVISLAACGAGQESTPAPTETTQTTEAPETTLAPTEPTEPPVDPDASAAENWQYDCSGYPEESEKIYAAVFGEFLKY